MLKNEVLLELMLPTYSHYAMYNVYHGTCYDDFSVAL